MRRRWGTAADGYCGGREEVFDRRRCFLTAMPRDKMLTYVTVTPLHTEAPMHTTLELLATYCCAIFAGASIYIGAVEHPARMSCGVKVALAEWAPSYRRATVMQASLAVIGFGFALLAWLTGAELRYLVAGLLLVAVAPFTLIVIMPTNKRLMALDPNTDLDEAAVLLARWNRLHTVRSVLSATALVVFLWPY